MLGEVHSIRYRIKDPTHLIVKIVRKRLERPEFSPTPNNYRDYITDLIGVRALHLFKDDWQPIHEFVKGQWDLAETPTANVRDGDESELFKSLGCSVREHKAGYRSVHYLLNCTPSKQTLVAELQVRTVFEEAWSEIDHRIRYPHAVDNAILAQYLDVFNGLAGSADQMGTYVRTLQAHLLEREEKLRVAEAKHEQAVNELQHAISKAKMDAKEKAALEQQVKKLSAEMPMTPLLSDHALNKPFTIKASDFLAPLVVGARERTCTICGERFTPSGWRADSLTCSKHRLDLRES